MGANKQAAERSLRTFFELHSCVPRTISIPVDRNSGIFKPFAFVEFNTRAALVKVLSLSAAQCQHGGRTLDIDECVQQR
jgi:RNA recognition motif-containing protein